MPNFLGLPRAIISFCFFGCVVASGVVLYKKYKNSRIIVSAKKTVSNAISTATQPEPKPSFFEKVNNGINTMWDTAGKGFTISLTFGKLLIMLIFSFGLFKLYKFLKS